MAQQPTKEQLQEIQDLIKQTGNTVINPVNIKNLAQAKEAIKILNLELRDMGSDLDYINKSFKDTLNDLSKQNVYLGTAKNSLRGISSIASQILEHKKGESALDVSQLEKLKHKAKLQAQEIQLAIDAGNLKKLEKQALEKSLEAVEGFNKELDRTIAVEKQVNKEIGLAGVALKGFANLMAKAGLGDLSKPFADAIDKTKDARRQLQFYKDAIEELESKGKNRTEDENKILASHKAQVAQLSTQTNKYKNIVSAVKEQLTLVNLVDYAVQKIVTEYFNVNKAAVAYTRQTGQNATAVAGLNSNLATSAQVLELMGELTAQTGIAAGAIFSKEDLGRLAEAKNLLGLSSEQAGNLGIRSKLAGKDIRDYEKGIVAGTNNFNRMNGTALSHGEIMLDVLNTSDEVALSLGNSDTAITKAAASAKSLGLSLDKVDQIADSMLNFEESIGYELEAQLLTGKNINLAKAREYALSNNLTGLSEELKKNGASATEFANMGRLEQEGLAKALGMSRSELAKSIMMQETSKNLTKQQRADAMGVSLEQLEQLDIQQKIQVSLAKLAQAFAPLLDVVVNLVDGLMFIVKPVAKVIAMVTGNPIGKYLILAVVAANFLGVAVSGVGRAFGSMYKLGAQAITGLIGLFKKGGLSSALGGLKNTLTGGFNRGATGMGASSPWSPGQQTPGGDKSKGMLDGIGKLPMNKILKGAGAILILSAAMFVAAKAFKEFEGVNFEQVMFGVGTIAALAGIAIVLGNATGPIIKGAFAVAILSASLIPLGYALNLAAPGIEAFGKVITSAFNGLATLIGAVADGFVKILGAVTMENIGPMLLLGPALFGVAAGLGAVALAGLAAIPAIGGLVLLSKAAPALVSLGMGGENKSAGEAKGKGEKSSLEEKIDNLVTELSKNQVINVKVGEKVLMELFINKASLYATSQG